MRVYYEFFQSQPPGNKTFEKVLDNIGRISVPDDSDVWDLMYAIHGREAPFVQHCSVRQLSVYPHGTDTKSPTLKQERSDIDLEITVTTNEAPLIITFPAHVSLINKRKLEDLLKTTQVVLSETGTRKSAKLLKVKSTRCCFLCNSAASIEASYVFQKSDVSYKFQPQSDTVVKTLQVLENWMKDPKLKRPFEIHGGPMNLIWLCHQHCVDLDHHAFCLKVNLSNQVLFHAFDNTFENLVASANSPLLDPAQAYFDLDYVSRCAVGMQVL
jgi:hypothetical protein